MTVINSNSKLPLSVSPTASVPVVTSIVIHAVFLGLLLPGLNQTSEGGENTPLDKVPVVELNAAEKTRLPNLSSPSSNLGSVDNKSTTAMLDPSLASTLPVIPNTFSNTLPPLPSLPPLSPSYNLPLNNGLPTQTPYVPPLPLDNNARPVAINPSFTPYYPPIYPPSSSSQPQENTRSQSQVRPKFDNLPAISNPDDLINNRIPVANSNTVNNANNQSDQMALEQWKERLIAQRVGEIERRRESLREDTRNTTDDEAMRNNITWMSKVRSEKPPAVSLDGIYPKDACLRQLEGTSVVGIVVDASGRITSTIDMIKSAGYPVLNQQAVAQVQNAYFKNTIGSPQPYRVSVNFKYDPSVCRGYTRSQAPLEVAPSNRPEVTRQAPLEVTPSNRPEVTRQAPLEVTPSNRPEVTRQAPLEVAPSNRPEVTRQAPLEVEPSIKPEVTTEASSAEPEVTQTPSANKQPVTEVEPSSREPTTEKPDN